MSEILSQEQIDALLNSQGLNDAGENETRTDVEKTRRALLKTFGIFCDQAGTVISAVLNKKVAFQCESCDTASAAALREKLPSVLLAVNLTIMTEIETPFTVLIQKTDAAKLSDLMMMGDGTAEYNEDHKDALAELFNQVMGAFTNAIGSEWGGSVTAGKVEVMEFDLDNPAVKFETADMILVSQTVEEHGQTYIAVLVTKEGSDHILQKTGSIDGDAPDKADVGATLNTAELEDLSKVTSFEDEGVEAMGSAAAISATNRKNIDMLLDIELDVSIELGRSMLSIKRILELAPGSIVELDRMAGEPVDLLVNNKVVAKGEVVVIDENFGIRIVSLVSPEERIRSLH